MKPALSVILTATLGTALPQVANESKLPWVKGSHECIETWRRMLSPSSTLQSVEEKCGTRLFCDAFNPHVFHDYFKELPKKFNFQSEKECLDAHHPEPLSECNQALNLIYESQTPVSRETVDGACGVGSFCETFIPEDLDEETAEFLATIYGYRSEQECLDDQAKRQ